MLVLSRKKDEAIRIFDEITIVVVEIRGDKVKLGIEAPKHVPVHRQEVWDAIKRYHGEQGGAPKPDGSSDPLHVVVSENDVLTSQPTNVTA